MCCNLDLVVREGTQVSKFDPGSFPERTLGEHLMVVFFDPKGATQRVRCTVVTSSETYVRLMRQHHRTDQDNCLGRGFCHLFTINSGHGELLHSTDMDVQEYFRRLEEQVEKLERRTRIPFVVETLPQLV